MFPKHGGCKKYFNSTEQVFAKLKNFRWCFAPDLKGTGVKLPKQKTVSSWAVFLVKLRSYSGSCRFFFRRHHHHSTPTGYFRRLFAIFHRPFYGVSFAIAGAQWELVVHADLVHTTR